MKLDAPGAWRRMVSIFGALAATAAVVWFAFPEIVLKASVAVARHRAGLERREVDVAGHRIVYLDGGTGTPVVLLHGFGANKDLWNSVARRLTPRYRVIAPDLPGFGETVPVPDEKYDAESQARRLHAFLGALGVREFHIGGNSMGGLISANYVAAYPEGVLSLELGDVPGVRGTRQSELDRLLSHGKNPFLMRDQADVDRLVALSFYRVPHMPGPIKRVLARDMLSRAETFRRIGNDLGMFRPDGARMLEPVLSGIAVRTLVLWGAGDRLTDPSAVPVIMGLLPNAQETIFAGCGHSLPWECPAMMASRYLEFLESLPAAGR